LSLVAWTVWAAVRPLPPAYAYVRVAGGSSEEFPELALGRPLSKPLDKYEVRVDGMDQALAEAYVGHAADGRPVLLEWRNHIADPLGTITEGLGVTVQVAETIARHLPAGARVLAWWDVSRRLRFLADCPVEFGDHLGQPVLVPSLWEGRRPAVVRAETAFWGPVADEAAGGRFADFVEALLAGEAEGVGRLRRLAGDGDAYLVVELADAFKLGALRPDRFGIGYKDFPKAADIHGTVRAFKEWVREQGYKSYAVRGGGTTSRVYFLTDDRSADSLLARLLPFSTSNPFQVEGLEVVYQHGDYWIFHLAAAGADVVPQPEH
jgi:hydroxylamine oxidation protein HaoB